MSTSFPQPAAGGVFATAFMVDAIDALLPQTQCTKCGYSGCRPYAEAIALGAADINQCPPGGEDGIVKLAQLLHRMPQPLNPGNGVELPLRVAAIDEARCIGCTLCIDACPVDAIVGAAKRMHSVLPSLCTGCDLCVAPCPVDCIVMLPVVPPKQWSADDALAARAHFDARNARLRRAQAERDDRLASRSQARSNAGHSDNDDANNSGSSARQAALDLEREATNPVTSMIQGADSAAVDAAVRAALQRARERRAKFSSPIPAPGAAEREP